MSGSLSRTNYSKAFNQLTVFLVQEGFAVQGNRALVFALTAGNPIKILGEGHSPVTQHLLSIQMSPCSVLGIVREGWNRPSPILYPGDLQLGFPNPVPQDLQLTLSNPIPSRSAGIQALLS